MGGLEACFIIKSSLVSKVSLRMKNVKRGYVSKETVVLRRWESRTGQLRIINGVGFKSLRRRVNAWNVRLLTPYDGQFTLSTQLIKLNYLENVTLLVAKKKIKNRKTLNLKLPCVHARPEIVPQKTLKDCMSIIFKIPKYASAVIFPSPPLVFISTISCNTPPTDTTS